MTWFSGSARRRAIASSVTWLWLLPFSPLAGQVGTVRGTVTRAADGGPVAGALVTVVGFELQATTRADGRYTLDRVPDGARTVRVRALGFAPAERAVTVAAGRAVGLDFALEASAVLLGDILIASASRAPERVVEAPAAVSTVDRETARDLSVTGQAPQALANLPGVDAAQSGLNDYNVNARGVNSSLTRRVLVLQDGRDLAVAFLGSQEWNALTMPLDDMARIEMVRGPGSALYGANAYSGVVSLTTPTAREAVGTRITVAGGGLEGFRNDVAGGSVALDREFGPSFRADLRHASVFGAGRYGIKVTGGYELSETWDRSRTSGDGGDLRREYAEATDQPVPATIEAVPLFGQDLDPATRAAVGDPDRPSNAFGSARFDYYLDDGTVATAEAGGALVQNGVIVTGIGRVQVDRALRPWGRLAWAGQNVHVMAWYSGRNALDPQRSLASGLPIEDKSHIVHGEVQYNRPLPDANARIVLGGSARNYWVNTENTLMLPQDDDRSDAYYSGYGQLEFDLSPRVRVVGAVRYDEGDLFAGQISPKGAIVVQPRDGHAVRFTVNRAFQTPNHVEFFLRVAAGQPADFTLLEQGLRASPLGPVLAGVPEGELFTNSAAVPVLAMGNRNLDVEHVTSLELGYKAQLGDRVFVTVDGYYSRYTNFVTDLLPGVNPAFAPWTAPDEVPAVFQDTLEAIVRNQLRAAGQPVAAAGLTRLADGTTAIVVSYTNAGEADAWGAELGGGVQLTDELELHGSVSLFDFELDTATVAAGDQVFPNTPSNKGTVGIAYRGRQGLEATVTGRFVDGYQWAAGVFQGRIPASETFDVTLGYQVSPMLRVHAVATNVFDQQRFHIYGGSIVGRRVLAAVTASF